MESNVKLFITVNFTAAINFPLSWNNRGRNSPVYGRSITGGAGCVLVCSLHRLRMRTYTLLAASAPGALTDNHSQKGKKSAASKSYLAVDWTRPLAAGYAHASLAPKKFSQRTRLFRWQIGYIKGKNTKYFLQIFENFIHRVYFIVRSLLNSGRRWMSPI